MGCVCGVGWEGGNVNFKDGVAHMGAGLLEGVLTHLQTLSIT